MPLGNVSLLELAEAVQEQIEDEVSYLEGRVEIIDPEDEDDISQYRKALGTNNHAVRIVEGTISGASQFSTTMEWTLTLRVTVLFRKGGSMEVRPQAASDGRDITQTVKDVVSALQGERLDLLNTVGLDCETASVVVREGSTLQAMRFQVTARSRETRS